MPILFLQFDKNGHIDANCLIVLLTNILKVFKNV